MSLTTRFLAPAVLAASLGAAAIAAPAPAQAQSDDLIRVLVDVATWPCVAACRTTATATTATTTAW